jgi:hypothetical protein
MQKEKQMKKNGKFDQIAKKFAGVNRALRICNTVFAGSVNGFREQDISPKAYVETADEALMFKYGQRLGFEKNSRMSSCLLSSKHPNMCARVHSCMLAVNATGSIIKMISWDQDEYTFAYDTFAAKVQQIDHVVFVETEFWYPDTMRGAWQQYTSVKQIVTVYKEPDQGWQGLIRSATIEKNLELNTRLLTRFVCAKDDRFTQITANLESKAVEFGTKVFLEGLQEMYENGKHRGAEISFKEAELIMTDLCGYTRVMLTGDDGSWVTLQKHDDHKNFYVLGCYGTYLKVISIIDHVIKEWQIPSVKSGFISSAGISVI